MINSIEFQNFRILRDTTLPLSRFTLLIGSNGSGKTTALQALKIAGSADRTYFNTVASAGVKERVSITLRWGEPIEGGETNISWLPRSKGVVVHQGPGGIELAKDRLARVRIYTFNATAISNPVFLDPEEDFEPNGANLALILDRIRDKFPEKFEDLNQEFSRWLPEYDRILFETPNRGKRGILLRTKKGRHPISPEYLSQGALFALALLTLAYMPDPPPIIGVEEPDTGIHPRLLREVRDALYRLSYPEAYGEKRRPVQVLATTHSPYLLDLFNGHPEEIVIAHLDEGGAHFQRLSDRPDLHDILQDAQLGEIWYSGILGGVPAAK